MSFFDQIPAAPVDKIFGLVKRFSEDSRKNKVNLVVGVYRDEQLKPYLMPSVKEAEKELIFKQQHKEYLGPGGDKDFLSLLSGLIFKEPSPYLLQSAGGSSALYTGALLLKMEGISQIALTVPTWANHGPIFQRAGLELLSLPYWDKSCGEVDFDQYLAALEALPEKTAVLLHACAHNPTGWDPTLKQWEQLFKVIEKRELFAFFDMAYHGFAQGLEEDTGPIKAFVKRKLVGLLAYSCSKNFSVYAERVGALALLGLEGEKAERVLAQAKILTRQTYSNPPMHGAAIIRTLLSDESLTAQWKEELSLMRGRLETMKGALEKALREELGDRFEEKKLPKISQQRGMFAYLGLGDEQLERLRQEFGIYMPGGARINVSSLSEENLPLVVQALGQVLKG